MKTNSEYKNMALQSLEGNWAKAAMATLITFIIMEVIGSGPSFVMQPTPPQPDMAGSHPHPVTAHLMGTYGILPTHYTPGGHCLQPALRRFPSVRSHPLG